MNDRFRVTGCGVSFECSQENVMAWVDMIIEKGGVPKVEKIDE